MSFRWFKITLLLFWLPCLTGCAVNTGLPITEGVPSVTLPPAKVSYIAPIGDAALEYADIATLYLPSHDGISLTEVETEISFSLVRPAAETIIRNLIAYAGTKEATSLGGEVRLALYGANPVEVSRNVATVNLGASALQLDRESLFIVCQAITNTLTELPDIEYVNVLVVDKPVGLDIGNTLPMGALMRNDSRDLSAVYSQLLSRRITTESVAVSGPLSVNVALYLPLQNSSGLICESRPMTFEQQDFSQMVTAVLREIASGPADASIGSTELPLLADLLTSTPLLLESPSVGGQIISLDFAHNLDDMLEAYGISRKQCVASLCYTFTSFFPNVRGITLSISGSSVDSMLLSEEETSKANAHVFLRSDFSGLIYDYCTLFFLDESENQLAPSQRAIAYHQRTNPRTLLCELAKGPQKSDSRSELAPIMKKGAITDTTLLGFALTDATLLTNFSPSFSSVGDQLDAENERFLVYALVNTLCVNERVRSVCFFLSGEQFDSFAGEIYWSGRFMPLPL